ncbi:MAG: pantoate--beta-alanine ligase, partial [Pseudomonadota bacterium]|nr:pantoate--beta-alanine ligase [Pseudomonadota bacterium]
MQIIREIGELFAALQEWREAGQTIALVPTMGALHAGHLALVDAARAEADRVVASIFVNPLQFGPTEDLDRYPRQEAEDAELLEHHGCDLLWMPTAAQLYPPGFATTVR